MQLPPQSAQPAAAAAATASALNNGSGATGGAAHKKRKRPHERQLPYSLQHLPEAQLYAQLQQQERRLDTLLIRKRLDIQEALTRPLKQKRQLRLYVSNRSAFQTGGDAGQDGFATGNIPSWTLRVEGRLLDARNGKSSRKMSAFFKRIVIELDRDPQLFPGADNIIEWIKTPATPESDGFEVKRTGDQNVKCKIFLHLDHQPEKFKLSPQLASLLNLHSDTKAMVIMAIWQYIKTNRLQDSSDHRVIRADEAMKKALGVEQFMFPQLPALMAQHLLPEDPIMIEYEIRADVERHVWDFVLDVEVDVDDPVRVPMMKFVTSPGHQKEIGQLDQQLISMIHQIHSHRLKRDFMLAFTQNPVKFINDWIASQARDLEIVLGENQVNLEAQRRADFYREPWVAEAVFHYLAGKQRPH